MDLRREPIFILTLAHVAFEVQSWVWFSAAGPVSEALTESDARGRREPEKAFAGFLWTRANQAVRLCEPRSEQQFFRGELPMEPIGHLVYRSWVVPRDFTKVRLLAEL